MKLLLFSFTLLLATTNVTFAQHELRFDEFGLSVTVPAGWTGQQTDGYYICGHTSITGLLILSLNESPNVTSLKADAELGLVDEGVSLQPDGAFKVVNDKRVEGYYQGLFDGVEVKCLAIGLVNPEGAGLNIMVLTTSEQFGTDHIKAANEVADAVKVFAPKESAVTREWKEYLTGKKLKYMNTVSSSDYSGGYSGSSDVTIINLYENGTFYYYSNSHASFDTTGGFGYANDNNEHEGRHQIYSVNGRSFLELTLTNGDVWEYELTTNSKGNTLLNGSRYFVVRFDE